MHHRLHATSRTLADLRTGSVVLVLTLVATRLFLVDRGTAAAITAGAALVLLLWRVVRGPAVGPVVVAITDRELVLTSTFFVPTKVVRFPLAGIRRLRVVGPEPGRRFRLDLDDGTTEDVRPYFGPFLFPRALDFLRLHLPDHIEIVEEKPAGLMAQVRGDY